MLILTRRISETLRIGDDISVTVLGVKGNQVRIGISAPRDVEVHREEIYARVHHEKSRHRGTHSDNPPTASSNSHKKYARTG